MKLSRMTQVVASVWLAAQAVFAEGNRQNPEAVPAPLGSSADTVQGNVPFDGSTIVSMAATFQPGLIYKKFPADQPVVPAQAWELSFGVVLDSQAASIPVSLRLADAQRNPDIQILDGAAEFVPQNGLYNNYDLAQRFAVEFLGSISPYLGPIDFVLEPDGFADVPVRVHLNATEQPGFPVAFFSSTSDVAVTGNITGDSDLEIVVPGTADIFGSMQGLYAFDHAGNLLPGWPFLQPSRTPLIVDLDGDGMDEILLITSDAGSTSLVALDGSAKVLWQVTGGFEDFAIPAAGDLDRDGDIDIVAATSTNLARLAADGTPVAGWTVETPNDIHVSVPIIGDLDGDVSDGSEIVACSPVFGPTPRSQVYVWNEDGTLRSPLWPKELPSCIAPCVVELDGNKANGSEIVMAIDFFDDPPVDPKTGFLNTFTVFAWHGNGSEVAGWPHRFFRDPNLGFIDDRVPASVSAADLDGDGDVEIVVGTYGQGDPANGNLFVFHHDGTLDPNWPRWAGIAQTPSSWGGVAIADLDGDGPLEIVTGSFHGVFAFRANGLTFEGFPKLTADNFAQATIADLDGDGNLEIVQASLLGLLHSWQLLTPSPQPQPWPQFRQNFQNTGAQVVSIIPTISQLGALAMLLALTASGALILCRRRLSPVRITRGATSQTLDRDEMNE